MADNTFNFIAGSSGHWLITSVVAVEGLNLAQAEKLTIQPSSNILPAGYAWKLTGFTSNIRYAEKEEVKKLSSVQEGLGRALDTCAALIPIKKSELWWSLPQDDRRRIFEETSHHIKIGMKYLPAIARKLYHCHDLGEPFDFLTWFEFEPEHASAFDDLVQSLRQTEEWNFVEREVDIRLVKSI